MSDSSDSEEYRDLRFLCPQDVGETEEVEKYEPGGFHPVHLGDRFDDGRYRVVHKLGAGGYATVWLARDDIEGKWVALKIVDAVHSASTATNSVLSSSALRDGGAQFVVEHHRHFSFDGPNGRHLCLVLPVLGPSLSELSYYLQCRLTPQFARKVARQATIAVAELHSRGLCHGDVTTGNLVLGISDIDHYEEGDIYRLFGQPTTGVLETESGIIPGPEAPRYIVKSIDFLSTPSNIIRPDVNLIDFDQCYLTSSPPQKTLDTAIEFLAPEVAAGLAAGPASDVWALGCCIFRLRCGTGPFENLWEATCPSALLSYIIYTLGEDIPRQWHDSTLWDSKGYPTKDASKGRPLVPWHDTRERSLRDLVYNIWDEPKTRVVQIGKLEPRPRYWHEPDRHPFPQCFSDMVWNPQAVRVDDVYLSGYDEDWDIFHEALPKIPKDEAALLYDLLTKIFVYDPTTRPTAREILDHPWFHLDELSCE
ncbi:hypothetical protein CP533_3295 [Ophiocordyceps camponoti-saundersi (nom. inval.)]|nr:hypothetical protein CP533_3295 [Ophiocordyceps camponoti-saundersi (nom. inval.)]